jgi:iron complex outermembrane receptor protein
MASKLDDTRVASNIGIMAISIIAMTIATATPLHAQDTAPAAPKPASDNEIIVTAQKRAENIQKVPLAVQVVNDHALQVNGVRNFADLSKVAPSLVVRPAEQPVNSSISIRGIGTFAFSISTEPSVAVQVDDVPVAFQARAFTNLTDIDRLEVLRGPRARFMANPPRQACSTS